MQEQQKQVDQLDSRVSNTEDKVEQLSGDVEMNKQDINRVTEDVTRQGRQLDQLAEVVEETVEKVDELDHKVRHTHTSHTQMKRHFFIYKRHTQPIRETLYDPRAAKRLFVLLVRLV